MTFDEARLMANVNARSRRLFEDGYRARWTGPHRISVRSGQGAAYEIDTQAQACGCPFFVRSGHPCKHVLGWRRLLARQRALRLLLALLLLRAWADLDEGCPSGLREEGCHG